MTAANVIALGSPGVGKSRSMTYLLRLLLNDGKLVVYEARKDDAVFVFVPPSKQQPSATNYEVYCTEKNKFSVSGCAALMDNNTYYLIDTGDVSMGEPRNVAAHTILASSPGKRRYHDWAKNPRTAKFCMPSWTQEEINAVRPYMLVDGQELSENEVTKRFNLLGGVPRYIFAEKTDFNNFKTQLSQSINRLKFEDLVIALGQTEETVDSPEPGSYPSILYSFEVQKVPSPSGLLYEQTVNNTYVRISSTYIKLEIAKKYWETIMSKLRPGTPSYTNNIIQIASLFECLASALIEVGGKFALWHLGREENVKEKDLTLNQANVQYVRGWNYFIDSCSSLPLSTETSVQRQVIRPTSRNQPVVDLMDCKDRAYQITVSIQHPVSGSQLSRLIDRVGATEAKPFQLIFVLLPHIRRNFVKQQIENTTKDPCNHVDCADLEKRVVQYSLEIPDEPPETIAKVLDQLRQFI